VFQGGLFTRDWLIEGITSTPQWQALDEVAVAQAWETIGACLDDLLRRRNPVEAETESKLVWPVIHALGWEHVSVQQNMTVRGRKDVPDGLLFANAEADEVSRNLEPWQRFRHGAALVEAKRWGRPLDREAQGDQGVPSTQLMHYLRRADDITEGRMRWGILTNGRQWRLYWQGALSVAEDFFEIDLGKVFSLRGCDAELFDSVVTQDHAFRLFLLLFGREAFLPSEQGRSFHEQALAEGRQWEARVARDLSDVVFDQVFPLLVRAIGEHDPARPPVIDQDYLEAVRSAALILLYRLLFVLYAEDRNLLPDERGPYAEFSLTRMRQEIADRKLAGSAFAARSMIYWTRLETIFGAIAEGDDDLGIPPYNGGLFDTLSAPVLARLRLPDAIIGEIVFLLSHRPDRPRPRYINYRDLSVQQLGSIYESILEYAVEAGEDGTVRPRPDSTARHRSGSYYTPEELVSLIIEKAVGPLVEERLRGFVEAVSNGIEGQALANFDPATLLLELRIVDPAMGSGHFLVSLVDWLSDKVLTAVGDAEAVAGDGYTSPLVARIAALRQEILGHARAHGWPIVEDQLDDRHIVRRMVLKRCVYGVDLNPMAVELAKVSLWLHSFTVGAPLSFLDHHLRWGNSVLGAWVRPTVLWLANRGSLMVNSHLAQIDVIAGQMGEIEAIADTDIAEVDRSKALFDTVAEASAPLDAFFSMIQADALMGVATDAPVRVRESADQIQASGARTLAAMPDATEAEQAAKAAARARIDRAIARARVAEERFARAEALKMVLEGTFGDPVRIAAGETMIAPEAWRAELELNGGMAAQESLLPNVRPDDRRRLLAHRLVEEATAIARDQRFFNWEIAFPGVWSNLASSGRTGGFDAVIGNPPFVRQEQISAIKPALEKAFGTYAGTADLYVYFYEQGLKLLRPGGRLAYVVTNKWLRAGYARGLRRLFAEDAWVEFLADFGHAKHFFRDADVFPSVIAVRKPDDDPTPETFELAVIPREDVPRSDLAEAVRAATYRAERSQLSEQPWTLERPRITALLTKVRANGIPLGDYAGLRPLYGIKTGFNEAFLIDTATKERLIREDSRAGEIIKPYLRGQDIDRWLPDWANLWMIFARRGIVIENYPSILRHLEGFRDQLEPKPVDWAPRTRGETWPGRKAGSYAWYEVQDSVEYFEAFNHPKILIRRIAFYSQFSRDDGRYLVNDSALVLPSTDTWLLACLNSPPLWSLMFHSFPHKKDEALALDIPYVEALPIPERPEGSEQIVEESVGHLLELTASVRSADRALADWLRVEFGLERLRSELLQASRLDSDRFIAAVREAQPRRTGLTPSRLAMLRDAFADVAEPARAARVELLGHERTVSDIVHRAYGLNTEDIRLLWETAPPRMPLVVRNPNDGGPGE
jgi:hypothetical protein